MMFLSVIDVLKCDHSVKNGFFTCDVFDSVL